MRKFLNIVNRVKSSDKIFFEEQFMYGHREILLSYSKQHNNLLTHSSILKGSIDHAWAFNENLWKLRNRNLTRADRYVWHKRQKILLSSLADVVPVGAPWLYMLNQIGINPKNVEKKLPKEKNKVLIFPSHNLDGDIKLDLTTSMNSFKSRITPNSKVTVCLFWLDFIDPMVRHFYAKENWEIVCAGYCPRGKTADSIHGGRQNFLLELFKIMSDVDIFLTDDLSTGALYAMSLGARIQYFESENTLNWEETSLWREKKSNPLPGFFRTPREWFRSHFPEVFETDTRPTQFIEFSWNTLGYEAFLDNVDGKKFKWVESSEVNKQSLNLYSQSLQQISLKHH